MICDVVKEAVRGFAKWQCVVSQNGSAWFRKMVPFLYWNKRTHNWQRFLLPELLMQKGNVHILILRIVGQMII